MREETWFITSDNRKFKDKVEAEKHEDEIIAKKKKEEERAEQVSAAVKNLNALHEAVYAALTEYREAFRKFHTDFPDYILTSRHEEDALADLLSHFHWIF